MNASPRGGSFGLHDSSEYSKVNKIILALLTVFLVACGPAEVSRTPHPETTRVTQATESCDKGAGYCYACGLGFNGKFECSYGFKYSCDGNRPVTRKVWDVTVKYEDGTERMTTDSEHVSIDGVCQ